MLEVYYLKVKVNVCQNNADKTQPNDASHCLAFKGRFC